jgi:thymidylate synthase (FAD)
MKLIKSSFEILPQAPGLEGIYKQIELAGRNCYKSEDKICEGSAIKMVDNLIKRGHGTPLEHGTVYLYLYETSESSAKDFEEVHNIVKKYEMNPFSKVSKAGVGTLVGHKNSFYITTNYRVLVENNWLEDLKYLCEPTEWHEKRISIMVTCAIGISREFNRHRTFSICEQSTRYCNYSLGKFSNEITYVIPTWSENITYPVDYKKLSLSEKVFLRILSDAEIAYMEMINQQRKPQEARDALPLATATTVMYTAFVSDWKHFLELRTAVGAHPDARALATSIKNEFEHRGYI